MMKIGPKSVPERYQNKGIFTRLLDGVKNGSSEPFVLLMFFTLPDPFPVFGSEIGLGLQNLESCSNARLRIEVCFLENRIPKPAIFLRVNLVFWTRRRWEIGLQKDQKTSMFMCDSDAFLRKPENIIEKVSIKFGHVSILGAFSWKSDKIPWKRDSKNQYFRDFLSFEKLWKSFINTIVF